MSVITAEEFLLAAEREQVRDAVRMAESRTSGEIRVHLDDSIVGEVLDHAAFIFEELGMHRTAERNGVLIYVSVAQRRAAVIGDTGIHAKLPRGFWNETLGVILEQFKQGRHCEGLCRGVASLGDQLQKYFPRSADDRNELSDDISIGS